MARLAFFGTPSFAVPSLQALLKSGHEVVSVICQADAKAGRGKKLRHPPVKVCALEAGLSVLQPSTLKNGTPDGDAFWDTFVALDVDLAVVTAYGRILARRLLEQPRCGFVNVHASSLPRWRGAAPIHRAIEAGDAETGVCLMDMVYALDAGDVYARTTVPIDPDEDTGALTTRLAQLGGELLASHLPSILNGSLTKTPQSNAGLTYAKMIEKAEAQIDWDQSSAVVSCHARAMSPAPGAFTFLPTTFGDSDNARKLKLFAPAQAPSIGSPSAPGSVLSTTDRFTVAAATGAVSFAEMQFPGKRRMKAGDALRGRSIAPGTLLGSQ